MKLRPFFSFFGSKWRIAGHYPEPRHDRIIEPFAGSAGYATRYPGLAVALRDLDPVICGVWDYILKSSAEEVMGLPTEISDLRDMGLPQEAKWLIGFWLNKGCATPRHQPSSWMKAPEFQSSECYWGEGIKARIVRQQPHVRHWTITEGGWASCDNRRSTWFIDPPYQGNPGANYRCHDVNYHELARFCEARQGQAIVCEREGAEWLEFRPFREIKSLEGKNGSKKFKEAVWTKEN